MRRDLHSSLGTIAIDYLDATYRFGPPPVQVSTSDRSGTLRLVRANGFATGYHSSGNGFTPLGISTAGTNPTSFDFHLSSAPGSPANVWVAFRNFIVNTGVPVAPQIPDLAPTWSF